jgi:hypothetical protein
MLAAAAVARPTAVDDAASVVTSDDSAPDDAGSVVNEN